MSSPSLMVETTLTFNDSASEQHVSTNDRYTTIIVENNTNVPVFVAVDGGTATAGGNHEQEIPVGGEYTFDNELALWNSNLNAGQTATNFESGPSGGGTFQGVASNNNQATAVNDQSMSWGWTAQQGFQETGSTYCSVVPSVTTSTSAQNIVTVTFQN
jgi:hypothetical protein